MDKFDPLFSEVSGHQFLAADFTVLDDNYDQNGFRQRAIVVDGELMEFTASPCMLAAVKALTEANVQKPEL